MTICPHCHKEIFDRLCEICGENINKLHGKAKTCPGYCRTRFKLNQKAKKYKEKKNG